MQAVTNVNARYMSFMPLSLRAAGFRPCTVGFTLRVAVFLAWTLASGYEQYINVGDAVRGFVFMSCYVGQGRASEVWAGPLLPRCEHVLRTGKLPSDSRVPVAGLHHDSGPCDKFAEPAEEPAC